MFPHAATLPRWNLPGTTSYTYKVDVDLGRRSSLLLNEIFKVLPMGWFTRYVDSPDV